MTSVTVPLDIAPDQLSDADRRSLDKIVELVQSDDTLTERARQIAIEMVKSIADQQHLATVEYLTPNQAAAVLGVSRPLVNRLLDEGRIPYYSTPGGHRRIKRSDLDAYVTKRDEIAAALVEARRNRRTPGEEAAAELGLDPATAKRLGLS